MNIYICHDFINQQLVLYFHVLIILWGDETGRHALLSRGWRKREKFRT